MEKIVSVCFAFISLIFSFFLFTKPDIVNFFFYIDTISKVMFFTISAIFTMTVLYSIKYVKFIHEPLFHKNQYFLWLNLFAISMFFSVVVNNLGLLWVGIEATTITSALLVAIEGKPEEIEATWRYIIIVSVGLILSLLGTIIIYGCTKTLLISEISKLPIYNNKLMVLGILFTIIGFGTKAGIFPTHTWLPDVHGKAPSPVSAIFSGVLLPVALFGIIRVLNFSFSDKIYNFTFALGMLTVITASLLMTVQKYYKRLYAYSSMENMGIALIGITLGKIGLLGAMIIIVTHAFCKSIVFYLTGNIYLKYHDKKIDGIKSLLNRMRYTGFLLFFAVLGVTGAPPFPTFLGEILIFSQIISKYNLFFAIVLGIFIAVAFISVNYYTGKMLFSKEK